MGNTSEEWFLEQLESETPDITAMLKAIDKVAEEGEEKLAESWAQLMLETFADSGQDNLALAALEKQAALDKKALKNLSEYEKIATKRLSHDRKKRRMVEDSGFDQKLHPRECVRRLRLLLDLEPGMLCYDATWGQGVVQRVDLFYHRVEIDFENKHDHQLSLAYAAETLQLLHPEHLLAVMHNDPDRLKTMAAEEPAELVKLTISSMGSMPVDRLQEELMPRVISDQDWKNFWSRARKDLKKDPLFELPPKRKDPMRILENEEELFGNLWFRELKPVRDMEQIVEKLELCRNSIDTPPSDEESVAIAADRLNFVITGSMRNRPGLAVRAALLAHNFGLEQSQVDVDKVYAKCLQPGELKRTTDQLAAKHLKPFLQQLLEHDQAEAAGVLVEQLPEFSISVLTEVADVLLESDYEKFLAAAFRERVNIREINARMLLWILRHPDPASKWQLGNDAELVPLVFRVLEQEQTNDDYSDYKRLRNHCEKSDWLGNVLGNMSKLQRREFTTRVMQSSAWSSLDRKSMLAKIIKFDPDMQSVVTPEGDKKASASTTRRGRLTSISSYNRRQQQLQDLINRDIPDNSREIAEARSHGDLRENAEFKAAKERQGLLMQRQSELEEQLNTVQATDFSEVRTDVVGPGTMVKIRYEDGAEIKYAILGEWDRDEELNIISSESLLAKKLQGHKAGEKVVIPAEYDDTEVTLAQVEGLNETIEEWIRS